MSRSYATDTVLRETDSRSASSRVGGNRSPGRSRPSMIGVLQLAIDPIRPVTSAVEADVHLHPATLHWPINDDLNWPFFDANPVLTVATCDDETSAARGQPHAGAGAGWSHPFEPAITTTGRRCSARMRRSHRLQLSPETIEAVWRRLHDRNHVVQGLVVRRTYSAPPVGLAHYRAFPRTFGPRQGCFVDDLFVDPAARGEGAASAVLAHLRRLAAVRGWGPCDG